MPSEIALMIAVILGAAAATRSVSYMRAVALSTLVYLLTKFVFVEASIIPEMAGGFPFTTVWFAQLVGQLLVVWLLACIVHRVSRPAFTA